MSPEETKAAFKEALKEWLDEQAAKLGWSIMKWLAAGFATILAYLILIRNGFKPI